MLKKAMAAAAIAVSVVGVSAAAAPQALALGDDSGTTSAGGDGAHSAFGDQVTRSGMSPRAALVHSARNKPCVGLPAKANAGPLAGLLAPVAAQDGTVLASPQTEECAEYSTQARGDAALSRILSDISALSRNDAVNG
ncbi:rodlin [Streptomyces sp. NPDC005925]|uniref:rodlin n=1 Tax=Streptomyces sp. NPDC005925 TaxID=3157172 RepID=UPI0033E0B3C1